SDRMILDRPVAAAARQVTGRLGCKTSPVLAYIANEIRVVSRDRDLGQPPEGPSYSRYSIVAGIDPAMFAADSAPPFGPFEFLPPEPRPVLGDAAVSETGGRGEIILNDWLAQDLAAHRGDTVRLTYHVVGSHGELPEESRTFEVAGIVKLDGTIAAD